jgi:hypothetical protein
MFDQYWPFAILKPKNRKTENLMCVKAASGGSLLYDQCVSFAILKLGGIRLRF